MDIAIVPEILNEVEALGFNIEEVGFKKFDEVLNLTFIVEGEVDSEEAEKTLDAIDFVISSFNENYVIDYNELSPTSENTTFYLQVNNSIGGATECALGPNTGAMDGGITAVASPVFKESKSSLKVKESITKIPPDGVENIDDYAFAHNNLTSVVIPNSVKKIGNGAFYNTNLTSVDIPDSVIKIGTDAFSDNNLTSVVIPDSVEYIGGGAFSYNNPNLIIYTDNEYAIDYCSKYKIPYKPRSEYKGR